MSVVWAAFRECSYEEGPTRWEVHSKYDKKCLRGGESQMIAKAVSEVQQKCLHSKYNKIYINDNLDNFRANQHPGSTRDIIHSDNITFVTYI